MVSYAIFVTLYLGVSTTWEWQLWEIFPILHLGCQAYIQTEKDKWEKFLIKTCPQKHSQYRTNCRVLCAVFIVNVIIWKQSACFCSNVQSFFKGEKKSSFKKLCVRLKIILIKNKYGIKYLVSSLVFFFYKWNTMSKDTKKQKELWSSSG